MSLSPNAAPAPVREAACPCCGAPSGSGSIALETREHKGSDWPGRTKYLVRTVTVSGVCGSCIRSIEMKRYVADVLCIVPFLVFLGLALLFDSKAWLFAMGIYALYLFKWAWGLGYVWSDVVMYGGLLEMRLGKYKPPGDQGTLRFPASIWHCLIRLGLLPALFICAAVVVGVFNTATGAGGAGSNVKTPAAPAAPDLSAIKDPIEKGRVYFGWAKDLAVPVDPVTQAMQKEDVNRKDMFFFAAFQSATHVPANTSYRVVTGPQLLDLFLKTAPHETDSLRIVENNLFLTRWQAAKVAAALPKAEEIKTPLQKSAPPPARGDE